MSLQTSKLVGLLAKRSKWRYSASGTTATEPAAFSALVLLAADDSAARGPLDWLARRQAADGSLGVTAKHDKPRWPTSLAVMAWQYANEVQDNHRYRGCIERAIDWILQAGGKRLPRHPDVGHNSMLLGWPWVEGTHSWVEPTVFHLLALKATGHRDHSRAREAVRLLVDRLLPSGGCNCGNTITLGQELLPHVQPSGLTMLALSDQRLRDQRIMLTLDYLSEAIVRERGTSSLCFAAMGLIACGREVDADLLAKAFARSELENVSEYHLALLALASLKDRNPLIPLADSKATT